MTVFELLRQLVEGTEKDPGLVLPSSNGARTRLISRLTASARGTPIS